MKLVKFSNGDDEVLINPERVSHIKKELSKLNGTRVYIISGGSEWVEFTGKDAEKVWDYFKEN